MTEQPAPVPVPQSTEQKKELEITLKTQHTHAGITYQAGEKISVTEEIKHIMKQLGAI